MYIGEGGTICTQGRGSTLCTRDFEKRLLYPYKGKFWEPLDLYIGEGGALCTRHLIPPPVTDFMYFAFLVCSCNRYGLQKKLKPRPNRPES